jgi:soluble lytic murein transglycosylase-like protein
MRRSRTRGVLGIGLTGAVWAAVTLHPTALARELPPPAAEPTQGAHAEEGPLAEAYRVIEARLRKAAPAMDEEHRTRLATVIVQEADAAKLDPLLVLAVIEVESGFRPHALSGAGARGYMQLLDTTLRSEVARGGIEGDLSDPIVNVRAGVRYLRRLLNSFRHEDDALMAYYAGPVRIHGYLRDGGIPDRFRVYPRRVKAVQRRLHRGEATARAAVAAASLPKGGVADRRAVAE